MKVWIGERQWKRRGAKLPKAIVIARAKKQKRFKGGKLMKGAWKP